MAPPLHFFDYWICLPFNHLATALTSAEFFSASSDIRVIAQTILGEQAESSVLDGSTQ
jgi:hypothetical protein